MFVFATLYRGLLAEPPITANALCSLLQVNEACAWLDGAESDGLPDPGELVLLTYTVRCKQLVCLE